MAEYMVMAEEFKKGRKKKKNVFHAKEKEKTKYNDKHV